MESPEQRRHVRWNWEESPEQDADNRHYVRYHFVVVDDRDREGIMNRIITGLSLYGEVILIRSVEGKVAGSDFRYLFRSFDCVINPEQIRWNKIRKRRIRDSDLRERKKGNIEDYVARVYGS